MAETPPPPPPNPPPNNDPYGEVNSENFLQEDENETLDSGTPKVAATPGKTFLVVGLFVAFIIFIFSLIFSDEEEIVENPKLKEETTIAESEDPIVGQPIVSTPPPPPPRRIRPTIPPPPPPPPTISETFQVSEEENAARQERLESDMTVSSGNFGSSILADDEELNEPVGDDPNLAFASRVATSTAQRVRSGNLGDLTAMIAQGKIIHAVLETAINTELPGQLRAIVSRDIYAEAGKARLIPKGSRLIGTYNTSLFRGQQRIFIVWSRVIRPDGVDMQIGSPGVDTLGRAGLKGHTNSRYDEILAGAILSSIISIGIASVSEEALGADGRSQTFSGNGAITSSSSTTSDAVGGAIDSIGNAADTIISDLIDVRQNITVDQGTRINVMVNKDLVFSSRNNNHFILP